MPKNVKTFFKDYVVPKAAFNVKPTLGSNPSGKASDSGLSGSVTPKELPVNSLKFGEK